MRRTASATLAPAPAPAAAPPSRRPSPSHGFTAVALRVQRQAANPDAAPAETPQAEAAPEVGAHDAGPPPSPDAPEARADGERLVEDEREPQAGQLGKSEFMRRLSAALDAGLSASLAGSGYTSESCPTLAYWLGFAANLSAARLERGLRLYVGLKQVPAQAEDYLTPMVARVQLGVAHWRATGEVEGVPIEWEAQAAQQEEAFVQSKAEGARAAAAPDPRAVRGALGHGQSLPGDVRASMETRLGAGFGHVRVHAGARAAEQARRLDARAFTVGRDVAFAAGEFAPGTLRGDLLLAHELAHTLQQGGAAGGHARKAERGSDAALERQADRAAAAAFAPELREAAGGRADLDEEALLREAEQAPPVPGGLRLQRCQNGGNSSSSSTGTPAAPPKPWWEEAVVPGDTAVLFCRPLSRYTTLLDLLRQVDVQVSRDSKEVLKTTPGTKKKESYIKANLVFTQWTPKAVDTELRKVLPMGASAILDQATLDAVKKIVADHRAKHPQTFSVLQGIEMASAPKWPTTDANCIATMNKATLSLYGPGVIAQMSELGTTVQDSIDAVNKKGLISEKQTFAAKYTGDAKRYQLLDASKDVTFSGAGKWIEDKAMAGEDGVHAFLLSVCNGFHSVSLVAMKGGGKVTIAWKDQIVPGSGIAEKTPAEIDAKVAGLCVSRYRYWMRDAYNKKHDPDVAGYDDVKKALSDDDLKKLEDEVKPSVNKDIGLNTVAKLKPAKV